MRLAFDHAGSDFVEDLPWCFLASVLRSVLPLLPTDMAAALAPLTRGGRETATPIDEALMAGGTPAIHPDNEAEITAALARRAEWMSEMLRAAGMSPTAERLAGGES